jgi:hypothetical protein
LTIFKEASLESDRNLINEICDKLHDAKVEGEGFLKNPKAACRVEIHFIDNTITSFGVKNHGQRPA